MFKKYVLFRKKGVYYVDTEKSFKKNHGETYVLKMTDIACAEYDGDKMALKYASMYLKVNPKRIMVYGCIG
jgi:hypothetical protein